VTCSILSFSLGRCLKNGERDLVQRQSTNQSMHEDRFDLTYLSSRAIVACKCSSAGPALRKSLALDP
jgi:hypothetical protein